MVIEHVFVTTLEGADTLRLAVEFLTAGGFMVQPGQGPPPIGGGRAFVELARGRTNAAKAKSVEELPQRVCVEWDRGRVTVAAYIQAYTRTAFSVGSGDELPAHSPKVRLHAQLMSAISQGLEILLAHRRPFEEALQPWQAVASAVAHDAAQRRRKSTIKAAVIIGIFALLIGLAIFAATR
jgi:hypothetical protein